MKKQILIQSLRRSAGETPLRSFTDPFLAEGSGGFLPQLQLEHSSSGLETSIVGILTILIKTFFLKEWQPCSRFIPFVLHQIKSQFLHFFRTPSSTFFLGFYPLSPEDLSDFHRFPPATARTQTNSETSRITQLFIRLMLFLAIQHQQEQAHQDPDDPQGVPPRHL